MDRATQREIMRADQERRDARLIEEYLALHTPSKPFPPHSMIVRADAKAMGAVTAQTTRVTPPWATLRDKCVGVAPGDDGSEGCSVLVTQADGTSEVRLVSSFRKGRTQGTRRTPDTVAPELTEAEKYLPSQADILGDYS